MDQALICRDRDGAKLQCILDHKEDDRAMAVVKSYLEELQVEVLTRG